jgi:hypothetical protein
MRILVLDPRNGDDVADLFVVDPQRRTVDGMQLNYVPELAYDAVARELLVVETQLHCGERASGACYWLKMYDGESLKLVRQIETPMRPMYAGFPNRSTRVAGTVSGRYVYIQELDRHPDRIDVYRTRVGRYDRTRDVLERGAPYFDSCIVDFGLFGTSDDDIFFHLCCEAPSTVAFVDFNSPAPQFLSITNAPARKYSVQETCGSWLDLADQSLYCSTRDGAIYRVKRAPHAASLFLALPIAPPRSVPLHHIYGSSGRLFVGVARDERERGLSLVSEIWVISIADAAVLQVITLFRPIINFVVTADGGVLLGVDPYGRALQVVDLACGKLLDWLPDLGITPAEVQLMP